MGFLNAWPLWSGLAAAGVAVPIIIHLLFRKHRKQMKWAAMALLRRALVVRSGQVRLEDFLVLFLRCLAILLIAAAFLRPTLTSNTAQWLGEKRVGIVVGIDASYSMDHGEYSRYENAIDKAAAILETAGQGEPVSLVLMSNRPQILLRRTGYDASVIDLLEDQENATPYRLSLERNLEQLEELVAELKTPAKECYIITDGQELDWGKLSDSARQTLKRIRSMASVFLVPIQVEGENNLSVTQLTYASGSLHKSGKARFLVEVRNDGRQATDGGRVEFFVGNDLVTRQDVGLLEPGKPRGVSFFTTFEGSGDVRLRAHLAKDDLSVDNDRFAVVHIRPAIRVLCVDQQPPTARAESRTGAYFAVNALRLLASDEDGPLQVDRVQSPDLSLKTLTDYDVILMGNVPDVAPEAVERIDRFVRRGGDLIVFLGDQVDAELYNQRFGASAAGLLPGELGETLSVAEGEAGWTLAPSQSEHALAEIVGRLPEGMADTARFWRIVEVKPAPQSQTILTIAERDTPLLLSREVGAGSVLMFTTSADRSWSELAIHPLYTMLLHQAVTNMTSRPDARQVTVGEPVELDLPGRRVGDRVQVTDPAGTRSDVKVAQSGARPVCEIETDHVGVYEVTADGDMSAAAVAANVDPAESDVRVAEASALAGQLQPAGIRVVSQTGELLDAITTSRRGRELHGFLLACGMIVFVAQCILAKLFSNRMSHVDADVSQALQVSRVAAARKS